LATQLHLLQDVELIIAYFFKQGVVDRPSEFTISFSRRELAVDTLYVVEMGTLAPPTATAAAMKGTSHLFLIMMRTRILDLYSYHHSITFY
jgi:hypothetical protein